MLEVETQYENTVVDIVSGSAKIYNIPMNILKIHIIVIVARKRVLHEP